MCWILGNCPDYQWDRQWLAFYYSWFGMLCQLQCSLGYESIWGSLEKVNGCSHAMIPVLIDRRLHGHDPGGHGFTNPVKLFESGCFLHIIGMFDSCIYGLVVSSDCLRLPCPPEPLLGWIF